MFAKSKRDQKSFHKSYFFFRLFVAFESALIRSFAKKKKKKREKKKKRKKVNKTQWIFLCRMRNQNNVEKATKKKNTNKKTNVFFPLFFCFSFFFAQKQNKTFHQTNEKLRKKKQKPSKQKTKTTKLIKKQIGRGNVRFIFFFVFISQLCDKWRRRKCTEPSPKQNPPHFAQMKYSLQLATTSSVNLPSCDFCQTLLMEWSTSTQALTNPY